MEHNDDDDGDNNNNDDDDDDYYCSLPVAVVEGKKRKFNPTIEQMRQTVADATGIPHSAHLPSNHVRNEYTKLLKRTPEYIDLETEKRVKELTLMRAQRELNAIETSIQKLNYVSVKVQLTDEQIAEHAKQARVDKIYSMIPKDFTGATQSHSEGGAYAHLTKGSQRRLFNEMKRYTKFDREATLLDVGGGANIASLHAAVGFCAHAVSIEIDGARVLQGAEITLNYLRSQGEEARNHRVALIHADALHCDPVDYATHVYFFDLAIHSAAWFELIDWIAMSTCKTVVLFKPSRKSSLLEYVLEALGAKEVARVRNLKMAASSEGCTALILQRHSPPSSVVVPPPSPPQPDGSTLQSTKAAAYPFMQNEISTTIDAYEGLIATMREGIAVETKQGRRVAGKVDRNQCSAEDFIMCRNPCAKCNEHFRPLSQLFLSAAPSKIAGQGLFSKVPLEGDTVVLEYSGTEVLHPESLDDSNYVMPVGEAFVDAKGAGVHQFVNHSCSPNSRFQQATNSMGDYVSLIVTNKSLPAHTELTVDYGDKMLNTFECSCLSPFCRQRRKVLFLGMVQYSRDRLEEMLRFTGNEAFVDQPFGSEALARLSRARVISEQHARDMYRIAMAEEACRVSVFTVDMNASDEEKFDRDCHFVAAFESPEMISILKRQSLGFHQIILDYFYSPKVWTESRWKPSFFKCTLPQLAQNDILELGGTVILPFQPHTLEQVALHEKALVPYYEIETLHKGDLQTSVLYQGTMACSRSVLVEDFGKDPLKEEEMYCRASASTLNPAAADRFGSMSNLSEARFLSLKRVA